MWISDEELKNPDAVVTTNPADVETPTAPTTPSVEAVTKPSTEEPTVEEPTVEEPTVESVTEPTEEVPPAAVEAPSVETATEPTAEEPPAEEAAAITPTETEEVPIPEDEITTTEANVPATPTLVDADDPIRVRIAAITEFWNEHDRFPGKAERQMSAGGARLADWMWSLSSDLARDKLSDEKKEVLETAPWWRLVVERADTLRAKLEAKKNPIVAEPPPATEDGEAAVSKDEGSEMPEKSDGEDKSPSPSKDGRKKLRAPYERKRPHTRNPLAEKARDERDIREAVSPTVPASLLPEIGLVDMVRDTDYPVTFSVVAERAVDTNTAAAAMDFLREKDVAARVSTRDTGLVMSVKVLSSDLPASVERLTKLGYTVAGIRNRSKRGDV
ncbi:MAG: hypothetical protein E6R04_10855 [Spirochaetes bacterium]|nr:MAG: hypothetical protein E6R04_10855 [Spirochaetota bacterium]